MTENEDIPRPVWPKKTHTVGMWRCIHPGLRNFSFFFFFLFLILITLSGLACGNPGAWGQFQSYMNFDENGNSSSSLFPSSSNLSKGQLIVYREDFVSNYSAVIYGRGLYKSTQNHNKILNFSLLPPSLSPSLPLSLSPSLPLSLSPSLPLSLSPSLEYCTVNGTWELFVLNQTSSDVECAFIPGNVSFPNDWLADAKYLGNAFIVY